jgi:hypothetical protein
LRLWIPRLAPGGSAWLVVQKNLGSDSLQRWLSEHLDPDTYAVSRFATDKGFRILAVERLAVERLAVVRLPVEGPAVAGPSDAQTSGVTPSATNTAGPASSTS